MSHVGCLVIFCKGVLLSRLPRGDNDPSRGRGHGQTASPSFPHLLSPSKGLEAGQVIYKTKNKIAKKKKTGVSAAAPSVTIAASAHPLFQNHHVAACHVTPSSLDIR